jgi:hypothetical protein
MRDTAICGRKAFFALRIIKIMIEQTVNNIQEICVAGGPEMSTPPDAPSAPPASTVPAKRKRRMTARWRYTNRLNARASTGPRTAVGKARVARNALSHGLSVPVPSDPGFALEVVELARTIAQSVAGQSLAGEPHELACRVADTIVDLRRVRLAKLPLVAAVDADLENCAKPLAQLWRLDRYERRALSRRKRAIRQFHAAVMPLRIASAMQIRQNKAMQEKANDSNEAPR